MSGLAFTVLVAALISVALIVTSTAALASTVDEADSGAGRSYTAVLAVGHELFAATNSNELLELRDGQLQLAAECDPDLNRDSSRTQAILADADGTIWAFGGYVVRWRARGDSCWTSDTVDDDARRFAHPEVVDGVVHVFIAGRRLALGLNNGELDRFSAVASPDGTIFPGTRITIPKNPASDAPLAADVHAVLTRPEGQFVATNVGFWLRESRPAASWKLLAEGQFRALTADGADVLAANATTLVRSDASGLISDPQLLHFDRIVRDIAADDEGGVWLATDGGLEHLAAHFQAQESAAPTEAATSALPGEACLNPEQALRWGRSVVARADTSTGCHLLIDGARGASRGVLATGSDSWVLLDPDGFAGVHTLTVDPSRPELLWAGSDDGLVLIDTSNRPQCSAASSQECEQIACDGPATGCSAFDTGDGLPSNAILDLTSVDESLVVETLRGPVSHHDAAIAPRLLNPSLEVDGRPCPRCLTEGIPWDASTVVVRPHALDLGDLFGLGYETTVNGRSTTTNLDTGVSIDTKPGQNYAVSFTPVDRHFNWGEPSVHQLDVAAPPLRHRLSHPLVVAPFAVALAAAAWKLLRDWDLKPVETAHARVRPIKDADGERLIVEMQLDRGTTSARRPKRWEAVLDLANPVWSDLLTSFTAGVHAQQKAARRGGTADYPISAAQNVGAALSDLVDPDRWFTDAVLSATNWRGKRDVTTRLLVSVEDTGWDHGVWLAHQLPWERLTTGDEPATYLADAGLVVVRMDTTLPAGTRRRPRNLHVLVAATEQTPTAQASRPLNRLESQVHYQALTESESVALASLRKPTDFTKPLAAGPPSSPATSPGWDVVRLHAHGGPQVLELGQELAGAVDWTAARDAPPTLWMLMACNAGSPAVRTRTIEHGTVVERTDPGLARALVLGDSPLGAYSVGFNTEVDLTLIDAFETLLLEQLSAGRQVDVAVRTARRALGSTDSRFALHLYANDPSLLLYEGNRTP